MILASKGGAALGSAMRSGVDEAEGRMVETAAVLPPPRGRTQGNAVNVKGQRGGTSASREAQVRPVLAPGAEHGISLFWGQTHPPVARGNEVWRQGARGSALPARPCTLGPGASGTGLHRPCGGQVLAALGSLVGRTRGDAVRHPKPAGKAAEPGLGSLVRRRVLSLVLRPPGDARCWGRRRCRWKDPAQARPVGAHGHPALTVGPPAVTPTRGCERDRC